MKTRIPAPPLAIPFVRANVSGATVLLMPVRGCDLFAADFITRRGAVDERPDEHGLASFTHEMLLRGTRRRGSEQLAFDLESIGAMSGAADGADLCHLSIRSAAAQADESLASLFEMIREPAFDPKEHEVLRRETLARLKRVEDDKFGFALREFLKTLFSGHGYGHPLEGEDDDVQRISPPACRAWHSSMTRPENMIFAAAGDFDANVLIEQLDKGLANWPGPAEFRPRHEAPPKKTKAKSASIQRPSLQQAFVIVGFQTPPMTHPDYPALRLASAVLGEGFGGRIFTHLRDEQSLAYACGSILRSFRLGGNMTLYIGTKPGTKDIAREGLIEQARSLQEAPPSAEDLERALEFTIGKYLMGHQSLAQRAALLASWEDMTGDAGLAAGWPDRLRAVTPEQVQAAAVKWWVEPTVTELAPVS